MGADETRLAREGAMPEEWAEAAGCLGGRLLPCVCDKSAKPARGSQIEAAAAAKIPSQMRGKKTFAGIAAWTRRPPATPAELALWQARPEHGILCRTGALQDDGVLYAVDADLEDAEDAASALRVALSVLQLRTVPVRSRGSARWAMLLREPGEHGEPKRIIRCRSGAVEVLGEGCQLALAGTHPSGRRYAWRLAAADGSAELLPGPAVVDVPEGTAERLIAALAASIGIEDVSADAARPARRVGESFAAEDSLADWLREHAEVVAMHPDGRIDIRCPWRAEHTGGGEADKPQDATYFPKGCGGYPAGGFRCLHAHSGGGGKQRTAADLAAWARDRGWPGELPEGAFPELSVSADTTEARPLESGEIGQDELRVRLERAGWIDPKAGRIESTADSVSLACLCPAAIGMEIRLDRFEGCITVKPEGADAWHRLEDTDITAIRRRLERFGFKPRGLGFDLVQRCVELAASEHPLDSMRDFLEGYVPSWDGVQRWRELFARWCHGTDRADYLAAVGEYFGAALWARATCTDQDGVKADIVPVLIGAQGCRKTTLVKRLAILDKYYAEIHFDEPDPELIRKMGGKLLLEVPELAGIGKREETAIKAFITKSYDDLRPLWHSHPVRHVRRCMMMMTTNEAKFLTDATGNRRYAPVHVGGKIDIESITAMMPQLWAEARELCKKASVADLMMRVEDLAAEAVDSATVTDSDDDIIADRVDRLRAAERRPGYHRRPITMDVIMHGWLGYPSGQIKGGHVRTISAKLQRAGMVSVRRVVPIGGDESSRRMVWELAGCGDIGYDPPGAPDMPEDEAQPDNPFSDAPQRRRAYR